MNPRIIIHNVFIDEITQTPHIRWTIEIPQEDGTSLRHGSSALDEYIEIDIHETN